MLLENQLLIRRLEKIHSYNCAFAGSWIQLQQTSSQYMYMGWSRRSADPYETDTIYTLLENDPDRVLVQAFLFEKNNNEWHLRPNPSWPDEYWHAILNVWQDMTKLQREFEYCVYIENQEDLEKSVSTLIAQGHDNFLRSPTCPWIQKVQYTQEQYKNTINCMTNYRYLQDLPTVWKWIEPYIEKNNIDQFFPRLIHCFEEQKNASLLFILKACIHSSFAMHAPRPWFCKEMLNDPSLFHEIEHDDVLKKALPYFCNTPTIEQCDDVCHWIQRIHKDAILTKMSRSYVAAWMNALNKKALVENIQHPMLDKYRMIQTLDVPKNTSFEIFCNIVINEKLIPIGTDFEPLQTL